MTTEQIQRNLHTAEALSRLENFGEERAVESDAVSDIIEAIRALFWIQDT